MPEQSSVAQVQTDFKAVVEELQLRVKDLRDLRASLDADKKVMGQESAETQARMEKVEARITELLTAQTELNRQFAAPRLSTDDADRLDQDKRMKAYLKFCRFAGRVGVRLTDDEKKALYPDGQRYTIAGSKGEPWPSRTPEQMRALVEDATGGILVPESFDQSIIRTAAETAIIRPLATVRTLTSNRERYRKMTELTYAYGQALELGGTAADSTSTPSEAWQYIEDAYGLAWLGVNELEDADIELLAFIQDSFARAKAAAEDTAFITGAGHASFVPEGLTNGATITRVVAANAASIIYEDLADLMYGYDSVASVPLKDVYRRAGVFIMHPFTELACMKIRSDGGGGAGTGDFMWQASVAAGVPNSIWGHRILTSTDMDMVAHSADTVIFGDIRSCYRILDRRGMTMQKLVELKATAGLVGFLFSCRNTGGIVNAEACRILQQA